MEGLLSPYKAKSGKQKAPYTSEQLWNSKPVTITTTAPTLYGAWQSPPAYTGFSPLARLEVVGFIFLVICAGDGNENHRTSFGVWLVGNTQD